MASAANQEAFERQLSNSLSRVIDFLKFAEAKNAALLTFSSAWTGATVNFLLGTRPLPVGMSQALSISLCLFVAAALVAIGSFLPRRKLEIFHRDSNQEKNLLFYGHIATFEVGAYRGLPTRRRP
jgi:hypothetical protein